MPDRHPRRHRFHPRALLAPLAVLALAASLAACASSGVNSGDFNLVSYEEEWQLGAQLERDIAQQMKLVNDRSLVGYVDKIGQALVAQTELAQAPWEFHVVDDPAVNAFNIPGGHVYVNTGLIAAADNASQLAGVMAHEIAHGVARHGTEQLSKSYGLNIVASLALGQNPAVYQQLLAQIVGTGTLAHFSREAEREADDLGVRWMYDANWDPRGMAGLFDTLLEQRQRQPSSVEQFFSSHPLTENRIQAVREAAAALPDKRGLRSDERAFQQVRREAARYN